MPQLTPEQAANLIATVMTTIEAAGIEVRILSVGLVGEGREVRAHAGWSEGDPWVVLHKGQRITPAGIVED